MIRFLFGTLMLMLVFAANAFEAVHISDSNIVLHKSGFIQAEVDDTLEDIREISKTKPLTAIPKEGFSFGFTNRAYWFYFELSSDKSNTPLYLEYKNFIASDVQLYIVNKNNEIIAHQKSDYLTPIAERNVQSFPARFSLMNGDHLEYWVRVSSEHPLFVAFELGNEKHLDKSWRIYMLVVFLFLGGLSVLITYALIVWILSKDIIYFYYILYLILFLTMNLVISGFLLFSSNIFLIENTLLIIDTNIQLLYIFLAYFSINILNLNTFNNKHKKIIIYLLFSILISALLAPLNHILSKIMVFLVIITNISLMHISWTTYRKYAYMPALLYFIATGVSLIIMIAFFGMTQGVWLWFDSTTLALPFIALAWDVVILSIALAIRSRILELESIRKDHIIMMQSRQQSIESLASNVAHQWRQPLAAFGALLGNMEAKLCYANPTKEELLDPIRQGQGLLKHLSHTVSTFQDFYKQEDVSMQDIDQMIRSVIGLVSDNMNTHNIQLNYQKGISTSIPVKPNEFSQVLFILLENAQNILTLRGIKNPEINISLDQIDREVIIKVSDNGGGILIEPVLSIFEPFVTDQEQGTGRGLFIAKMIIEKNLKGNITARNDKHGAVFTITYCTRNL